MEQNILTKVQRWSNLPSTPQKELLSQEKLDAIVQLPKIFAMINDLLSRYQWQTEKKKSLVTAFNDIQRRMREKRLYLGVIGEFNAGKSTFINALLEDELLTTSITQATTASITKLEYGQELDVEIQTNSGQIKKYSQGGFDQALSGLGNWIIQKFKTVFRSGTTANTNTGNAPDSPKDKIKQFINSVTADEVMASKIKEVRIFHPSKILKDELVIVDTPGTDSRNQRHTHIAKVAAEELCDLVLVIVPVTEAFSQNKIIQFLEKALGDSIHRCIFIGSQIDRLDCEEDEDIKMQRFFKNKLKNEFNIANPEFFFVSAKNALDAMIHHKQNYRDDLEWFRYVREKIRERTLLRRHLVQIEKTSRLTIELTQSLKIELETFQRQYEKEHQALIDNMIPDVDPSWENNIQSALDKFNRECERTKNEIINKIYDVFMDHINTMKSRIVATSSTSELESVSPQLNNYGTQCNNAARKALRAGAHVLQKNAEEAYKRYIEKFQRNYKRLASLGGQISTHANINFNSSEITNSNIQHKDYNSILTNELRTAIDTKGTGTGFGVGSGAVLGQMIIPIPGVGAAVGALVGGFFGSLFGPSLEEIQMKCCNKIESNMNSAYRETKRAVSANIDKMTSQLRGNIKSQMQQTINSYRELANIMRKRDEQQKARLRAIQRNIEIDIGNLNKVRTHLELSLEKLRGL